MTDYRMPSTSPLLRMAAVLCLRADDLEAMARRPADRPPIDAPDMEYALAEVPRLWVLGELIWALAPLRPDQIDAVTAFGRHLPVA
jgi:hypothetical protein